MGQAREVVAGTPRGHVEGLHRQDVRLQRCGNVEAHDPTREDVRDKGDLSEPRPGGETYVTSATQSRRGAAAVNRRWTRSVGLSAAGSDFVVKTLFERFTPRNPTDRMIRPVWSRPITQP